MIYVISDVFGFRALVEGEGNMEALRAEFDSIDHPGENPLRFGSVEQKEYMARVQARAKKMVKTYGGIDVGDFQQHLPALTYEGMVGKQQYLPSIAFAGWLVATKGFRRVCYQEVTFVSWSE